MKNHVEQESASNMEDDESGSPNKGKEGIDVEGGDSDIDYKFSNATERDDKLSASNKGNDISFTSSIISNTELSKMMKELPLLQNRANCCDFQQHILSSQNVAGASSQQHKRGNIMKTHRPASMPSPVQFKEKTGILSETMAKFEIDGGTRDPSYGEDDQVIVDIDSLTSSVESMISQNLIMFAECCIFRVPPILRRHRKSAYIPNAFSIGPWHRNHPLMRSTEKIKLQYLKHLLSRESESGVTLKELFKSTTEIEKEARSCYAEPIHVGVEDFVRLLVIDGCFLIELFRKYDPIFMSYLQEDDDPIINMSYLQEDDDPIFNMSCMMQYLRHDLILIENQIPWLVLEHLFNKTSAKQSTQAKEKTLAQLALQFFATIFSSKPHNIDTPYDGTKHLLDLLRNWLVKSSGNDIEDVETPCDGKKHLLDLLRNCLVKSSGNDIEDVQTGWEPIPSATDLVEAGIKLKVSDSEHRSILDIKFKNGSLEMPSLLIDETTEVIIRNLISYEQCSPQCTDRITSYAVLLDSLINTTKDMDIFTRSRIINNWLNPEEATQFFNKLYHDAFLKTYYYLELHWDVNKYCRRRCPRWRALLMRNYFGTPWAIVSIFAAATLLILTVVQTIFTVMN